MFHSCIIPNNQKLETTQICLSTEGINKMWYIHTMECYSAIRRNEILLLHTTWMGLENTVVSERSTLKEKSTHKAMHSMIPFI